MDFILRDGTTQHRLSLEPSAVKWFKQNPPAEYALVEIRGIRAFVKRQSAPFPGWGLLVSAISDQQIKCTARVLSICRDESFFYYFSEHLIGYTLEQQRNNDKPNISPLVTTLQVCDALEDINRRGFWFTDLCAKNIFVSKDGYRLIDLDSSLPLSVHIRPGMQVSYEHKALLSEFASKELSSKTFNLPLVGGDCINQAEAVSFAVDASRGFTIPAEKRRQVTHRLLENSRGAKLYHALFTKLAQNQADWQMTRTLIRLLF